MQAVWCSGRGKQNYPVVQKKEGTHLKVHYRLLLSSSIAPACLVPAHASAMAHLLAVSRWAPQLLHCLMQ
jgi:hypothetical protein